MPKIRTSPRWPLTLILSLVGPVVYAQFNVNRGTGVQSHLSPAGVASATDQFDTCARVFNSVIKDLIKKHPADFNATVGQELKRDAEFLESCAIMMRDSWAVSRSEMQFRRRLRDVYETCRRVHGNVLKHRLREGMKDSWRDLRSALKDLLQVCGFPVEKLKWDD